MSDDDRMSLDFEGHEGRDCGEHRTVGPHRAWCHDCSEWCYPDPDLACARCTLSRLRAEIERLHTETRVAPDAWTPAETDSGEDGRAPVWHFETVAIWDAESVTAWNDVIELEGSTAEGWEVDAIERDARRILSAVAWHRRAAAQASTKVDPASRSEWTSPHTWRDPDCIECGGEGAPCCEPPAPVESEETP